MPRATPKMCAASGADLFGRLLPRLSARAHQLIHHYANALHTRIDRGLRERGMF
jgi:hypothetical protein